MFKLMCKKIITILLKKVSLSGPMALGLVILEENVRFQMCTKFLVQSMLSWL